MCNSHHRDLRAFPEYIISFNSNTLFIRYIQTLGLLVGVTRCGNLYGGGDLNFNRVIPGTIRSLLLNERPILRSDESLSVIIST